MTDGDNAASSSCIDLAAEYLAADPAAVERTLLTHVAGAGGRCVCCRDIGGRWPCAMATIARQAHGLLTPIEVNVRGRGDRI